LLGHTMSKSIRSLMSLLLVAQSADPVVDQLATFRW
jgi:hypothetical protein